MLDGDAGAWAGRRGVTEIGNDMTEKTELTGCDISLLKRALAIAVAALEQAPPELKSVSTQYDMNKLLGRLVESDDEWILYVDQTREIVGGGAD